MRVALVGYGRMGKAIESLLPHGDTISWRISSGNTEDIQKINPANTDVAIDFSVPDAAYANIETLLCNGVATVSGTTAWLDRYEEVLEICTKQNGAFLYASNFSVGVNILFALNKKLASLASQHHQLRPSISEYHHIHKLDAPSGTAITLAEQILHNHQGYKDWSLIENNDHAGPNSIPVRAYRMEEIPGTHEVKYESELDAITIKHIAKSREGFAQGAILAARWILDKKGIFTMQDVLDL